jgi:protein-tyrosine phosphatase
MRRHGIEIAAQESRQIKKKDFEKYDLFLVMDSSNFHDVMALTGDREDWQRKVKMFLADGNVPDPYYGGAEGFTHVYELVNAAADAWTDQWRDNR